MMYPLARPRCVAALGVALLFAVAGGCNRTAQPETKSEAKAESASGCHDGRDPVCHMKVPLSNDDPKFEHEGKTYCFCNETDRDGFKKDPKKYLSPEWQQHPRMLNPDEVK